MHATTRDDELREILTQARTIAVLGGHPDSTRPASYVPYYLSQQGYRVIAVNPLFVGRTLWGQPVHARLAEIPERVDIVDVFRRVDALSDHVADILAMEPLPRVVWLQAGLRHDGVARRLAQRGVAVVDDRCIMSEHWRLGLKDRLEGGPGRHESRAS